MNPLPKTVIRKPWQERLVLFSLAFIFWLLLAWPVSPMDGHLLIGDIIAGVLAESRS